MSRWLAVLAAVVLAGAVLLVVELAIRVPAKFSAIGMANPAALTVQLVLFGCCFASIAFGIGAWSALGSGHLTVPLVPGREPLRNGIQWTHWALLAGLGLYFAAVGMWGFNRRDLVQGG